MWTSGPSRCGYTGGVRLTITHTQQQPPFSLQLTPGADDISDAEIAAYTPLQHLVMNWGLRPCWVETAVGSRGVHFVRRFPALRLLTLLVDFSEHGWPEPCTARGRARLRRNEVKRIWALVRDAFREGEERHPGWRAPGLRIVLRSEKWCRQGV